MSPSLRQPSSCIFINNCSFTYLSLRYKFPVTASVRGHRINAAFWNAKRELDNFTYLVTNVTVTDTLSSLRRRWQLTDTLDKAHCRYEHTHTALRFVALRRANSCFCPHAERMVTPAGHEATPQQFLSLHPLSYNNSKCHGIRNWNYVSEAFTRKQKSKGQVVPVNAMKACRRSKGNTPLILNLNPRWRLAVSISPRPLYHRERIRVWVAPDGPQSRYGYFREQKNILPVPGLQPRTTQFVDGRYTGRVAEVLRENKTRNVGDWVCVCHQTTDWLTDRLNKHTNK